ncbi:hypothetical protein CFC21_024367 [Triticum aestivum]|uniref:BTB domain-containing protein n=4 Tax=Triticum TaxID=4564 RepID=A0A9R1RQ11_TRITD|nr:BTB/POZ domain-containing protein At2g24240-like [Triticum aestivum]KAF7009876.1 hypothetical protein CFC21_024367 [Triticum aestivum]VAH49255.1 unnamed protein product [Triticum turgidum subsp. durum]
MAARPGAGGRVRFNVGGQAFETTTTTLANAGRDSMLGALLDASWNVPCASAGGEDAAAEYFIDRNPACFAVLLDLLRTGSLHVPPHLPEKLLYREALYYGLLDHVRAARWGTFDGDRLRLASSVPGRAPGDGTAVRAAPDGGCCVAHGGAVHVYNWMLDERRPVSLDHSQVNDVAYLDASTLLIAARERLGKCDGGMAAFSAVSGDLRHRFRVQHDRQAKSFTAGALAFDRDSRIFASCKGRLNEYGIGVWDSATGEQADFFYEPPGCALGDADRLQWLDATNALMVATLFPKTDNCSIGLLDFRDKSVAWSWSDAGTAASLEEKRVLHAIAMEDERSVCVINQYDDLGFLDLRSNPGAVRWSSRSKLMNRKAPGEESCYPKLATHGGQLFSSMNDSISVFSGPEHVLTSTLRRSYGGAICDFSIGGDRLFALHNEENVFDVWETPPPPII